MSDQSKDTSSSHANTPAKDIADEQAAYRSNIEPERSETNQTVLLHRAERLDFTCEILRKIDLKLLADFREVQ